MTAFVLGLPEHKVRVIAPDVGGGFGSKIFLYAEETCAGLGVEAGQPADQVDGRAQRGVPLRRARPRPRDERRARARQGRQVPRACACTRPRTWAPTCRRSRPASRRSCTRRCSPGQYTTPAIYAEVKAVFTNTAPVDAYRGAGRPEATYVVERLVDTAAREMNIGSRRTRSAGAISSATFPYQTPVALHLRHRRLRRDASTRRMKIADVAGFAARKAEAKKRGKLRGLGYCVLHRGVRHRAVEHRRRARRARRPVRSGRSARASDRHGHGLHRLAQPRPGARDDVRAGRRRAGSASRSRTSRSSTATPGASRSAWAPTARARSRSAARRSSRRSTRSIAKGKKIAAHLLEARRDRHRVRGRQVHASPAPTAEDRSARSRSTAYVPHNYPLDKLEPGLERDRVLRSDQLHLSRPARYICEVEVDPDTGVRAGRRRFTAVRRLRQHHQPDDRRRPGARRPRAGHRPGAARAAASTTSETGQLLTGSLHGLRDAARRRPAELQGRDARSRRARTIRSASRAAARRARSARRRR